MHVQEPTLFLSVHLALDPHGDGKHGFTFSDVSSTEMVKLAVIYLISLRISNIILNEVKLK